MENYETNGERRGSNDSNASFRRRHRKSKSGHSKSSSLNSIDSSLHSSLALSEAGGDDETVSLQQQERRRSAESTPMDVKKLMNSALIELYEALGGAEWRRRHGWMTVGSRVSNWHGLEVKGGGITAISLVCNDLSGRIPVSVGDIVMLENLNLSYNQLIVGWIPKSLGSLQSLRELHLHSCSLEGRIPDELGNLRSLEVMWLNGNKLTGPLPPSFGKLINIRELYLNSNSLEGEIPKQWHSLHALESLNVSYNRLKGRFPDRLAATLISLRNLCLDGNQEMTDPPPVAETGPELAAWLGKKRLTYVTHLERKLEGLEKSWNNEGSHLNLELERSRARIRMLEAQVNLNSMGDTLTSTTNSLPPRPPGEEGVTGIGLSTSATPPRTFGVHGAIDHNAKQYRARGRMSSDESIVVGLELLGTGGGGAGGDSDSDAAFDDRKDKRRHSLLGSLSKRFSTSGSSSRKDKLAEEESRAALRDIVATQLQNAKPPEVIQILSGEARPPYSLARFKDWAARNLLEENIDFYLDVQKIQAAKRRDVAGQAKLILDTYITPGSELEVNVSSNARKEVTSSIHTALKVLAKNPRTGDVEPLRQGFAPAEREVLALISTDAYPRFINYVRDVLERFASQQAVSEVEVRVAKEFLELQRLTQGNGGTILITDAQATTPPDRGIKGQARAPNSL